MYPTTGAYHYPPQAHTNQYLSPPNPYASLQVVPWGTSYPPFDHPIHQTYSPSTSSYTESPYSTPSTHERASYDRTSTRHAGRTPPPQPHMSSPPPYLHSRTPISPQPQPRLHQLLDRQHFKSRSALVSLDLNSSTGYDPRSMNRDFTPLQLLDYLSEPAVSIGKRPLSSLRIVCDRLRGWQVLLESEHGDALMADQVLNRLYNELQPVLAGIYGQRRVKFKGLEMIDNRYDNTPTFTLYLK